MEAISHLESREIPQVLGPTIGAFLPLLARNEKIVQAPKKTYKYGATDRHQLDVYFPTNVSDNAKVPVLFFVYGGGYHSGDRVLAPCQGLVYTNLGAYFAERGFLTVIPDYRLVPGATYPQPAEDVRDAISWVIDNASTIAADSSVTQPDTDTLFLMAHSAGAGHAATMLYSPEVDVPKPLQSKLRGVILGAGAYHMHGEGAAGLGHIVAAYWGSSAEELAKSPVALVQTGPADRFAGPVLFVEGEREPDSVYAVGREFRDALLRRTGTASQVVIAKGHNHISPNVALGSGQGEEWAEEVVEWMRKQLV